jgi:DNA polymerase
MRSEKFVLGEGPGDARVMLVGEQPGDREDKEGRPFVGPAGKLLDKALERTGLQRADVYVTNVVKRFSYKERGKRRIHQKPGREEIAEDRPLLDKELETVRPEVLVLLGATAAQALLGSKFRVTRHRGEFMPTEFAPYTMATVHPSSILRADDREQQFELFVRDLEGIREKAG